MLSNLTTQSIPHVKPLFLSTDATSLVVVNNNHLRAVVVVERQVCWLRREPLRNHFRKSFRFHVGKTSPQIPTHCSGNLFLLLFFIKANIFISYSTPLHSIRSEGEGKEAGVGRRWVTGVLDGEFSALVVATT